MGSARAKVPPPPSLMRPTTSGRVTGHLGRPSPQPVQPAGAGTWRTDVMDQSASAKTMIITTPVKIADVMALSRIELISEWIGAP